MDLASFLPLELVEGLGLSAEEVEGLWAEEEEEAAAGAAAGAGVTGLAAPSFDFCFLLGGGELSESMESVGLASSAMLMIDLELVEFISGRMGTLDGEDEGARTGDS